MEGRVRLVGGGERANIRVTEFGEVERSPPPRSVERGPVVGVLDKVVGHNQWGWCPSSSSRCFRPAATPNLGYGAAGCPLPTVSGPNRGDIPVELPYPRDAVVGAIALPAQVEASGLEEDRAFAAAQGRTACLGRGAVT